MLVSQNLVTGEPVFQGRGVALERPSSLGTSLAYHSVLLIKLFLHVFAVSLPCHQNFYLFYFFFPGQVIKDPPRPPPPAPKEVSRCLVSDVDSSLYLDIMPVYLVAE